VTMIIHWISNKHHCKTLPCIHTLSRRTCITCHSLRFNTETSTAIHATTTPANHSEVWYWLCWTLI